VGLINKPPELNGRSRAYTLGGSEAERARRRERIAPGAAIREREGAARLR
jgi:hypothetical protein